MTTNSYEPDYSSPEYLAFCDEQEAIHSGNATELTRCYLCHLAAEGTPDLTDGAKLSPLRGIIQRGVTRDADPTETLLLNCGHTII